ncbi:MAG: hypothetical protein GX616_09105 [Planctomycetes bacterium]|nr:hypothetical protein [Planctomycetota bacterium]
MLLSGELDALMSPVPPNGFYERGSLMVRLAPDYRKVEQDYARRVGFFPAHHIIALRREPFEREPWIASSLFRALDQSKKQWQAKRRQMDDASPWVGADFEDMDECVGKAWAAYGIEPNRKMIEAMCEEMLAQGLVDRPIDPASVFADFEKVMGH